MKKLLFLAFVMFSLTAVAQQKAEITFEEKSHDFGNITEGEKAKHKFVFTNTGDAKLVLTNVKASCGCTTPEWPKEPILPGEKGHITAVYNSKGRPGKFHKSISVTSNAGNGVQVIYIKGVVNSGDGEGSSMLVPAE